MKRIVIGCDGTWQTLESPVATNVRRICESVAPRDGDVPQIVYYGAGIGTRTVFDRYIGGAFGMGINTEITDAYTFLCANYEPGDEIYLFGFSRGAYTVRSLAGLIFTCGILRRDKLSFVPNAYALYRRLRDQPGRDETARKLQKVLGHGQTTEDPFKSRVRINFLGVWDTVGALGIPDLSKLLRIDRKSQAKHEFHNTFATPIVDYGRHAVAVDERRKLFRHTEMNPDPRYGAYRKSQLRQVWFAGGHGLVGGGDDGLPDGDPNKVDQRYHSDSALGWMVDEVREADLGLRFDHDILDLRRDPTKPLGPVSGPFWRRLSNPLQGAQPPKINSKDERPFCAFEDIHPSVIERWRGVPDYRPSNLAEAHGNRLSGGA